MACANCPEGSQTLPLEGTTVREHTVRVPTPYNIPIKWGEPLSSACERAGVIGSIPEVTRYPGFTTINGGVFFNVPSSGGIGNLGLFFRNRGNGCYQNANARLASTCC